MIHAFGLMSTSLFVGTYKVTTFVIFFLLINSIQELYLLRGEAGRHGRQGTKAEYFIPEKTIAPAMPTKSNNLATDKIN